MSVENTHMLLKITEELQNIAEILEDDLRDEDNPLTNNIICDKLLMKYNRMNEQSRPKRQEKMKIYFA